MKDQKTYSNCYFFQNMDTREIHVMTKKGELPYSLNPDECEFVMKGNKDLEYIKDKNGKKYVAATDYPRIQEA